MKKELKYLYDLCVKNGIDESELKPYFENIESNLKTKRYGLVWEEQLENIASDLKNKFPILVEREDLSIKADPNGLTNCLLEGDNYESLTFLKNSGVKVDCIYIDPPYNTGNQDFVYNDKYIDTEDTWRHSSWLSFMNKRLKLAKELLTEDGVIFISIDDNEMAQLKLLCDSIFGEKNFIANIIWKNNYSGRTTTKFIANTKEYILFYCKDIDSVVINKEAILDETILKNYNLTDTISNYKKGHPLHNTTKDFHINNRPNLSYAIYYNPIKNDLYVEDEKVLMGDLYTLNTFKEITEDGYYRITPKFNSQYNLERVWRWGSNKLLNEYKTNIIFKKEEDSFYPYTKSRLIEGVKYQTYKDMIEKIVTSLGTSDLKELSLIDSFQFPKPILLVKHLLKMLCNENATIIDFFAGSGTTGHAVLELNKEDGGTRKFILCTNNEVSYQKELDYLKQIGKVNGVSKKELTESYKEYQSKDEYVFFKESEDYAKLGICRSVTYERLNRVITGYTTPKGKEVEGIPSNLKYFKVENLDSAVNHMEIEDEVIDNIIPFIQFKHNVWGKETVVEDLIMLTSEKEDIYVHMNKLYLCDDFYDSINNKGKPIVLYIYDGLFEILDAARLGNVKVVSIPSEFYKK